jgi:radical SAM family uncharacterized protein/radical SAM-linked protein
MRYTDCLWFNSIERPSRYIGGELRSIVKDPSDVKLSVALAFPDVYEVGMSHLGLKILYSLLNKEEWIAAERVFCPWTDLEMALRKNGIPLLSLETGRALAEFDIVGFSLQHELCYTNVLTMLDLGGIPLTRDQRSSKDPLVIGGGPMCFNPEPVADFFDLFLVGDAEEALPQICRIVRDNIGSSDRCALLRELSSVPGVYVPGLFEPEYDTRGQVSEIKPLMAGYDFVTKAVIPDLDLFEFPTSQVIPFTQLVHDRLAIEIARGCTRGCRFCQAGMIYRPVRERSLTSVLEAAAKALENSGYEELSLLSLSSGDHSCIDQMLRALMDRYSDDKVALSLPSLRVDTVSPVFMEQIKRVRKTGFTLAVEAGSERLRKIINKGISRDEVLAMAEKVYGAGWNLIKLYFMVGLPFEGEEDLKETVRLAMEIADLAPSRRGGDHLTVSVSTFVPKAHTPFMWARQAEVSEAKEKIAFIEAGLRKVRVKVKGNPPDLSRLEGVFSRGDRRLGRIILEAWKKGARFDGWGELFKKDVWDEAFSSAGLDPLFYLTRERGEQEIFPWEHIRSGVSKEFLLMEWRKAQEGLTTPDCRRACLDCGVCDHRTIAPVLKGDIALPLPKGVSRRKDILPSSNNKYRVFFSKTGTGRFLGHLEMVQVFLRALRRASIPLDYSKGFHPLPKVSFSQALPLGTESLQEWADLQLRRMVSEEELKNALNRELPPFLRVTEVKTALAAAPKETVTECHYRLTLTGGRASEEHLQAFREKEAFYVKKAGKNGIKRIDAKPFIRDIRMVSPEVVDLRLKQGEGPVLRPAEIIKTIFDLPETACVRVLKTRQVLGTQGQNHTCSGSSRDAQ